MNPQVKEKWINALRSGEYKQGREKLRSPNGYCCLGVLCDLYSKEKEIEWTFKEAFEEENTQPVDRWYFDGESEFLPQSVKEWAELEQINPLIKIDVDDPWEDPWSYHEEVANLNDTGYTFTAIANLIEQQL